MSRSTPVAPAPSCHRVAIPLACTARWVGRHRPAGRQDGAAAATCRGFHHRKRAGRSGSGDAVPDRSPDQRGPGPSQGPRHRPPNRPHRADGRRPPSVPANSTPEAEFNVWFDPHAAEIVFSAGVPIVMLGLDVTRQARMDRADLAVLAGGRRSYRERGCGDDDALRTRRSLPARPVRHRLISSTRRCSAAWMPSSRSIARPRSASAARLRLSRIVTGKAGRRTVMS